MCTMKTSVDAIQSGMMAGFAGLTEMLLNLQANKNI